MDKVKVFTLKQPWAQLVVEGHKKFETRSRRTNYTGELYIHASQVMHPNEAQLCKTEPFKSVIANPYELKTGHIIGRVFVEECIPTEVAVKEIDDKEFAFGDYTAGRWAWRLSKPEILVNPVHAKGNIILWDHYFLHAPEFLKS